MLLHAVERRLPLALVELIAEGRDQGVGVNDPDPSPRNRRRPPSG